jgi:hypothetical protein
MPTSTVVVIRENPLTTHRPVEALRIALGLTTSAGPVTVILLGPARRLLNREVDDIVDLDVLETYLPSLKDLQVPFLVPAGTCREMRLAPEFAVRELPLPDIARFVADADRVLCF